ncbi:MAG: NAD(P)/FAD-dependent oxidoreductase [bacterium]|nr:NAD(P)/FAD-dependent oxidoreductase [bacterium]
MLSENLSEKRTQKKLAVVGGGAAGFFAAIAAAERYAEVYANSRDSKTPLAITIFEANRKPLNKVRISGGGRCNLTHACYDPKELIEHYPRGARALQGVFARFQPRDTIDWFARRGVETKTEADGRMFPVSDDSATIVNCLLKASQDAGIRLLTGRTVTKIEPAITDVSESENPEPDSESPRLRLQFQDGVPDQIYDRVILAAGGSPGTFELAAGSGHRIVAPVPSIFTFAVKDARIVDLPGLAVEGARVRLPSAKLEARGPVLITHWGFSGPAILRLSAFGARKLHDAQYQMDLLINWLGDSGDENSTREFLRDLKRRHGARLVAGESGGLLPARLWKNIVSAAGATEGETWARVSSSVMHRLVQEVVAAKFRIQAKGVFKEEFVTAGGVNLKEVDFRSMRSKRVPGLFLAGEILDIDGVTGGFNFQSAWSTGWLAGRGAAESLFAESE